MVAIAALPAAQRLVSCTELVGAEMDTRALAQLPIAQFLDRLASGDPTPGGGACAALGAALAAGLGQMVCAYTVGRPKFAAVEARVRELDNRFSVSRAMLTTLIDEDAAAYAALRDALKIDKADPRRPDQVAAAAEVAAAAPLEVAALASSLEADLNSLAAICNPQLRSDAECAAHFARAARLAALRNVRANLSLLAPEAADRFRSQADRLAPS